MRRRTDWRGILNSAAARVQQEVEAVSREGMRSRYLGTGASGDRTLLADRRAEEVILNSLAPIEDLRILSEEAGEVGDRDSRFTAVVDPIDGSSNYQRGIPFYCTSIAIIEGTSLGGALVALVRNLVTGEEYYAEKGMGTTKDNTPISTSGTRELPEAVAAIDLSRAKVGTSRRLAPILAGAARQVHFGANCLELCLLAEGKTDAFIDIRDRVRLVDFAGAYLIAKEAGAVITTPLGGELDPELSLESRFSFVASANKALHRKLLKVLKTGQ